MFKCLQNGGHFVEVSLCKDILSLSEYKPQLIIV